MNRNRLLPYVILQILPVLILPPSMLFSQSGINFGAVFLLVTLLAIFTLLGWGLMQGKGWALTMSIFMQGMNLIIRLMMLFPNAVSEDGVWDIALLFLFLVSIVLSAWLMVRLDRPDVRSMIVS
jgi:membrane-associated HD superfamily phosphohydrolase